MKRNGRLIVDLGKATATAVTGRAVRFYCAVTFKTKLAFAMVDICDAVDFAASKIFPYISGKPNMRRALITTSSHFISLRYMDGTPNSLSKSRAAIISV